MASSAMIRGMIDKIFGLIWITMPTLQIDNQTNKVVMRCLIQGDLSDLSCCFKGVFVSLSVDVKRFFFLLNSIQEFAA